MTPIAVYNLYYIEGAKRGMAKREGDAAGGSNGKKQGFSSRLLQMKFMQRKQEKRKADEDLDQVSLRFTCQMVCCQLRDVQC